MRYLGGKIRLGKKIAQVINSFSPKSYHEPFCGLFSVGCNVGGRRSASDTQPDLILMMNALQCGWVPPDTIGEEEYGELQYAEPSALRGFVGFGCSFYGKFFGGYARDKNKSNYAGIAKRSLLKIVPQIKGVDFQLLDYRNLTPGEGLIYCDPPYSDSTSYSCGQFNNEEFWEWVRGRSEMVLVSEYTAPDDFEAIWERPLQPVSRIRVDTVFNELRNYFARSLDKLKIRGILE